MVRNLKWILQTLLAGAILVLLVWAGGSILARPVGWRVAPPPPPGQRVELRARDGVALEGSYWPGAAEDVPAVLLLHGINNDRTIFAAHSRWLNELGYGVLAIDFRGHGASAAVERTFGWRESADAEAALAWLRRRSPERRIGVIGVSLGGAAALLGEDGPLPADALVLHAVYPHLRKAILNRLERSGSPLAASLAEPLLSFQSWLRYGVAPDRISPLRGISRFRGAVLVIGGTADRDTRIADSRALYQAAPGPKALWLIEGASHVETSKLWTDEYRARIRCLFARTLGEPPRHREAARPFEPPCVTSPSSWTVSSTPARATAS
jgi:pimeloyl-ACP methyl ester carboxylesterase